MSNRYDFVVKKYRLFELTFIDAEFKGKKLGHGKLMSPETLQKFVDGDPSGNCKYLDWMLFMAGGGQHAMEKALHLWEGESADDQTSLRNLCRKDFITEQTQGFTGEDGRCHPPVSQDRAQAAWAACEERIKYEFVMGDEDVASEDGYGFYRNWPGRDQLYQKILSAVQLWHSAQPKLLANNQRFGRARAIRSVPRSLWVKADQEFMAKFDADPVSELAKLDIYDGWKPDEFSQVEATYKTLESLLSTLREIRVMQILRDDRTDVIYEDANVKVICPLTIGASLKFGATKWCVSNRTDFRRTFGGSSPVEGHWKKYCEKGPLVFMLFKVAMPVWCHKVAIHIDACDLTELAHRIYELPWYDVQNSPGVSVRHADFIQRVDSELSSYLPSAKLLAVDDEQAWGGRRAGPAWTTQDSASSVRDSIGLAVSAIIVWGRRFDRKRVVVDYTSGADLLPT